MLEQNGVAKRKIEQILKCAMYVTTYAVGS
jgi:hypothetical protein